MGRNGDPADPRGLIVEAYRIEGISPEECRSIFLDWALGVPDGEDVRQALARLRERHAPDHPDHPMTKLLEEGLIRPASKERRRRGRLSRRGAPGA